MSRSEPTPIRISRRWLIKVSMGAVFAVSIYGYFLIDLMK